ncbi:hypothetical protein cand_014740 [Cryptosporidium andersoni]|uniref:Transmembrane protein n=1 Tax=Cryptosporidium andersoni TaxID=117008 RepID=A0A1J4MTU0_9CRYT|nr:hypothetical protein cand_014740 [Cryptosporidium andersoni]
MKPNEHILNSNDWIRQDSIDQTCFLYENLSDENTHNLIHIGLEDKFSPRLSEGLNSMRFSEIGEMTEEEWNNQQRPFVPRLESLISQKYTEKYIEDEGNEQNLNNNISLSTSVIEENIKNDEICTTLCCYMFNLIYSIRERDTIRGKQAQLTLWELMKQFYLINNLFFIIKVLKTILTTNKIHKTSQDMGWISFMCLLATYFTSWSAYLARAYIFYHRIDGLDKRYLFSPFHVYSQIRIVGEERPDKLYMLERVNLTYTLIMHILEDIPQLFASSLFLSNYGNDFYAVFMITWSSCMIFTTTIRMGISYPLIGTLSLMFSREPPVDSPSLYEATTTTIYFPLFMAVITFGWAICDSSCLYFTHGFWSVIFYTGLTLNMLLSTLFLLYYFYLSKQASTYIRQLHSLYITEDFSRIQSRQA